MVKLYCDSCEQEITDKDFRFEAKVREIKQSLLAGNPQPQLVESNIHLCKKCYGGKFSK